MEFCSSLKLLYYYTHRARLDYYLLCSTEKYYLVFWEEEDSVSVVPQACLAESKQPTVGEVCDVILRRKRYSGRISATGTVLGVVVSKYFYT